MPYYIYKITTGANETRKTLDKLEQHDAFKDAKVRAREMRAAMDAGDQYLIKVMFADNEAEAEQQLTEKRDAPILKEWEK
jgi:hypothetical protein